MLHVIKIKNKSDLVKYDLNINVFNNYDFEVIDIIPMRKIFILETDKGYKILKRINYNLETYNFILKGLDYIRSNGFDRIMKINKTKDGKNFYQWKEDYYFIMDMIDGRESQFDNPIDVETNTKGIADLHIASEGFKYYNTNKNICGNMIENFKVKLKQMELFYNIANLNKENEFDKTFLEIYPRIEKQMKDSIKFLEASNYYKLCSEENKIILCHHDLAHHNLLIKDNETYFIDFDYAVIDLKIHDLSNFINKIEKNNVYDFSACRKILKIYNSINNIEQNELSVMYGFLSFPKDIYDITKNYYTRLKDWEYKTFIKRFENKIILNWSKEEFLNKYRMEYLG
ncbi:CotS family spore coat protein [Clostridium sediminicola]|uniref:CotS family spore coat protein n=1 Tax=Clostridium sediminicola TaxID=3114879 RepID=UPI0031F1F320